MVDVEMAAHHDVDLFRRRSRGPQLRRKIAAARPADVNVSKPRIDEDCDVARPQQEASNRNVHPTIIGKHPFVLREVEADVEVRGQLAQPIVERDELEVANPNGDSIWH